MYCPEAAHRMEHAVGISRDSGTPLLQLRGVEKRFVEPVDLAGRIANVFGAKNRPAVVHALAGVDLDVQPGEVVGVVGESGCGKSTLGRVIADISPASAGEVRYLGQRLQDMSGSERRAYALGVQMIFQNPMASLNPRMRVLDIIGEAPVVHGIVPAAQKADYVAALMTQVGLDPDFRQRYPHQFSGGQRQRIGVARALALKPRLIVCDEAVAALDVSIQAQVLNLFLELRRQFELTYLFISHNLGVVGHISDRVVVMYLGRVVEVAPTEVIFSRPSHPYTQALLSELPSLETRRRSYQPIQGELPSPLRPPTGCSFHPRCPHAMARCASEMPVLRELGPGHASACHLTEASLPTFPPAP
jgi:peptide/nickel transport system ATP-binding protein